MALTFGIYASNAQLERLQTICDEGVKGAFGAPTAPVLHRHEERDLVLVSYAPVYEKHEKGEPTDQNAITTHFTHIGRPALMASFGMQQPRIQDIFRDQESFVNYIIDPVNIPVAAEAARASVFGDHDQLRNRAIEHYGSRVAGLLGLFVTDISLHSHIGHGSTASHHLSYGFLDDFSDARGGFAQQRSYTTSFDHPHRFSEKLTERKYDKSNPEETILEVMTKEPTEKKKRITKKEADALIDDLEQIADDYSKWAA